MRQKYLKQLSHLILLFGVFSLLGVSCSDDADNMPRGSVGNSSVIVLFTTALNAISSSGATCGGNITADGGSPITSRGVCWSTMSNPTILNSFTSDGSGLGSYSSSIVGLSNGVTYFVRAYAINANGTAYGNELSFTASNSGGGGNCVGGPSTVTDVDGNVYNVVTIGNQCWMKKNLKTSKYRNGDPIITGLSDANWYATTSGAYAFPGNLSANNNLYGKLYNYYAVADPRGLCPTGWHVPTNTEWNQMVKFLDTGADTTAGGGQAGHNQSYIAGGMIKETGTLQGGTSLWESPNNGATNLSGFTGLPAGYRDHTGYISNVGQTGYWYTSTQNSTTHGFRRYVYYADATLYEHLIPKTAGLSVRCVRD